MMLLNYPDDSFDNMIKFSNDNEFNFPYLQDETQEIAKVIRCCMYSRFFWLQ